MGIFKFLGKTSQKILTSQMYAQNRNKKIGGKTLDKWDSCEKKIGILGTLQGELSDYNSCVGIYKAYYKGEVVYIGRAIELNNGGFRKRLTDYIRKSDSARGTNSSSKMNKYKDEIKIGIIIVGNNDEAIQITKQLEKMLIGKYKPEWNVEFNR